MGDADATASPGRRNLVVLWSIGLSLLTLFMIGWGWMIFWQSVRDTEDATNSSAKLAPVEINERIVSKFVSPSEDEALDIVRKAVIVKAAGKVEQYFRLGGATPEEVVEFNKETAERDGQVQSMDWLSSMDLEGLLMEGVLVTYSGKHGPKERLAFLVPDDKGVWKLDFEGFAMVSRPSWPDLLAGRADHSMVRVFVTADAYFNGPFIDESTWVCYAMASPETKDLLPEEKEILHGYCRVGSKQAKAMARIVSAESRLRRVTLEIRKSDGIDRGQFEIVRVMSEDWVLAPKSYDDKFN